MGARSASGFGCTSQPWTATPSLRQDTLSAAPQQLSTWAFARVTGAHSPAGPAHTSGGFAKVWRTTAVLLPSLATENAGPARPVGPVIRPAPRQVGGGALPAIPAMAAPRRPSRCRPYRISREHAGQAR